MRFGLSEPLDNESDFLPITARAYLYLSGTPFKALSSGEFIEEQIFIGYTRMNKRLKKNFPLIIRYNVIPTQAFPKCVCLLTKCQMNC